MRFCSPTEKKDPLCGGSLKKLEEQKGILQTNKYILTKQTKTFIISLQTPVEEEMKWMQDMFV
jgi:hypothetical protein